MLPGRYCDINFTLARHLRISAWTSCFTIVIISFTSSIFLSIQVESFHMDGVCLASPPGALSASLRVFEFDFLVPAQSVHAGSRCFRTPHHVRIFIFLED
jgi:hypothetical protein